MVPKPPECYNCSLYVKDPNGFVRPEGTGSLGVLALGEGGGEREYREGLPFRPGADAGSVLERAFKRLGYDRQQWALANIVNCRPNSSAPNPAARNWLEGAPWELDAINSCRVHRDQIVARYKPKCIVALGGIALRVLTGMAGWKQGITDLRGYVLPALDYKDEEGRPIPVIGATHPAYLRRASGPGGAGASTAELGVLYQDLRKAVEVARTGWDFEEYQPNYHVEHDAVRANAFLAWMASSDVIAYDIETNVSADVAEDELLAGAPGEDIIQSIQFSWAKECGVIWPWREPFIGMAKTVLAFPHRKIGFNNWCFDDKVLAAAGVRIEGKSDDLMWAFHSLQPDLPMGLQSVASHFGFPFPWKHWSRLGGRDKQRYGCADVDVLHWIDEKIWKYLEARKVTRSYVKHKREFDPFLRETEIRGVPINLKRREKLGEDLSQQEVKVLAKIREEVPDELQKVHPPQGYKKEPKEVVEVRERMELSLGHAPLASEVVELMPPALHRNPTTKEMVEVKWDFRPFSEPLEKQVFSPVELKTWRWCKILPFKPTAWQQVLAYIKYRTEQERKEISNPRKRKWKVPKTIRGDRETTERRELERLISRTKDPVLKGTIEHREVVKMKSTYVTGWKPGLDGRVHTTFGYNTGSGQLTSKRPNIQNGPKHREIAQSWRRMIEARPGYVLVEMDFKGLHSVTTGFEARDLDYIRISKIDIHSFLLSHYLKREGLKPVDPRQSDDALAEELRWVHKNFKHERDTKAKHIVHGRQFGLRPHGCYKRYEDDFENEAEVKSMFAVMAELFSRHMAWMPEITQKAHDQTFLLTSHGYIRWFYCVFDWNSKRGDWGHGADHEAAIAYLPANDGHGHLRDAVLRLREERLDRWIINLIHDSAKMEMPDDARLPERIHRIHEIMSAPSEVLIDKEIAPEGLQVGVDVEAGRNWGKFNGENSGGMRDWDVRGGGYG